MTSFPQAWTPNAIPADRTLDDVTPEEWNAASHSERTNFFRTWMKRGFMSFCCVDCGYPLHHGWSRCEACKTRRG